ITLPMQLTASRIAEHTLAAGGMAVFRDGNVLELPSASLEVAEACSGLRSAISLAAIGVLLASAQTGPAKAGLIWRRVAIVAAATGAVARAMRHVDIPHARLSVMPYDVEAWNGRDAEPLDADTVRILAADEYLNRNYSDAASAPVNLYIAYYGQQRPGVSIHS